MRFRAPIALGMSLFFCVTQASGQDADGAASADTDTSPSSYTLELHPAEKKLSPPAPRRFSVRVTADDLIALLESRPLSIQLQGDAQQAAAIDALRRIGFQPLIEHLRGFLDHRFGDRFAADRDLIRVPMPENRRIEIATPELAEPVWRGPNSEVIGFMLHDVTEDEFQNAAVRFILTARLLLDTGDPKYDRSTEAYVQHLADSAVAELRAAASDAQSAAEKNQAVKERIAGALGVSVDAPPEVVEGGDWLKESRRFSYIIRDGKFIDRLQPLVERINKAMETSGFSPPGELSQPGIFYDPEIGDVEIVLPKPMLIDFIEVADSFERRMAEDALISIEALRLTDRDLLTGALASRLNAEVQGVHDVNRFKTSTIMREVGLNSLLAIANQQLQLQTFRGVEAGAIPDGVAPISIAPPTLPPIDVGQSATTIGSTFSIGADDLFFDGREQRYGFSYIGPDGLRHTLSLEVVDSLRDFWDRIERNLIVHKIKKTDTLTEFSVPVGPNTRTYNGIAALISQENQQLVVATGTGAISEISATAGTWLVIEDFEINPIPGSSTTLTEDEMEDIEARVLLTMLLRDSGTDVEQKLRLLEATERGQFRQRLLHLYRSKLNEPIRGGLDARTYATVFEERYGTAVADERFEKRERNSAITLTFYSSQGNIVQAPGTTQLGDANDLTSFTTELRPNVVTPISSFFTKSGSGTKGTSPLTGADKGEQINEEKTMTHLLIRARFPTIGRERADRDEGRFLGYFNLPIERQPNSVVDLPFLSSSDHPLERVARLRVGLLFPVLDETRIRAPFARFNPNAFPGDVTQSAWEAATTRARFNRKIISDSPHFRESMMLEYRQRFIVEVRSLLEYDPDFFNAPNTALRNMAQWNRPERIIVALNQSPQRFALARLIAILDELGKRIVTDEYAAGYLAVSPPSGMKARRLYPLGSDELRALRRDVAAHTLRFYEVFGDAFLEAVANVLQLGTYASTDEGVLTAGPFRGYLDLVILDRGARQHADPSVFREAQAQFRFLKEGGYKGRLFEKSTLEVDHLPKAQQAFILTGTDILGREDMPY